MAEKFPELKKTISSYISEENGRITKQTVLTLGAILAGAALSSAMVARDAGAQTLHQHSHMSARPHSSHSSHGSY
jgi:hypothetical protein